GAMIGQDFGRPFPVPGRMTRLEGDPDLPREGFERAAEEATVLLEGGRQLKEHRTELVTQVSGSRHEPMDRFGRVPETPDVREVPARLDGDHEVPGGAV